MKKMLLIILGLVLAFGLYVGGMILYAIATQYEPAATEDVAVVQPKANNPKELNDSTFTFFIWNLGYGGLGAEVDFFYDGGKMVVSPKEHVLKNNKGIIEILTQNKADFMLLQEVDRNSRRSWKIDQVEELAQTLPDYDYAFALNYDVRFLPFPFTNPLGKIYGGIQTFSKYTPVESKRIALPNITDFPRRLFYLKRCMLMQRYKLAGGKDLVVINTHFEAYDKGGTVKKEQMQVAKQILQDEYAKGNYVIIGGDWNIAPPAFNVHTWEKEKEDDELYLANNDANFIPGWQYAYDASTPTNRKNKYPFDAKRTFTTVIDYFFVSPNVQVEEVKGVDAGFQFSDHNPVKMEIKLK